jgi:hypothetical protein
MPTEESLKRELARLRKEHTALFKQAVQDATSWQRMETIERKTINVLSQLTEYLPDWKDDPDRIPQFGRVAEEVEKVNPDLVVRDADGKINTLRYEAVSAMLHNQFLKEHCKSEEPGATIIQLQATVAHQQKQIEALTASLQEQASQIQKVSDPLGLSNAAPQLVVESDDVILR